MNDIQKAQSERILSCYGETPESLLEKGGEGSKGGKIIGHTKSGKPIYDTHSHPTHKDFTTEDHKDAAELHRAGYVKHMWGEKQDKPKALTHLAEEMKHAFHTLPKSHEIYRKWAKETGSQKEDVDMDKIDAFFSKVGYVPSHIGGRDLVTMVDEKGLKEEDLTPEELKRYKSTRTKDSKNN